MRIALLMLLVIIAVGDCRPQAAAHPKAAILFKNASEILRKNPKDFDSLRSALNILDSAIHLDSSNLRYLFTKCKICISLKRYDLALSSCNSILSKYKDDFLTTVTKGVIFDLSSRNDSAMETYRQALYLLEKTRFEKSMYKEHERIILLGLLKDTSKFNSTLESFKEQFKNEKDFIYYYKELKEFDRVGYLNSYSY